MSNVFISYSRKDSIFARRMFDSLVKEEISDIWVDWADIPYSVDWWQEIQIGIDGSENFVFIITTDSLASMICNQELAYARATNKRIIPIIRREGDYNFLTELWDTEDWKDIALENWHELNRLNYVFCRKKPGFDCQYDEITKKVINPECDGVESDADNFNEAIEGLVSIIRQNPEHVRTHTRILTRAREWETNNNNPSFLLNGDDLREADAWLSNNAKKEPFLTSLHNQYIASSRLYERRNQRLRNTAIAGASFVIGILAIFAIIFALNANTERHRADDNAATSIVNANIASTNEVEAILAQETAERRADESQSMALAANAQSANLDNQSLALALAIEANSIPNPPSVAQQILSDLAYAPGPVLKLEGHAGYIDTLDISPSGRYGVTTASDDRAIVWDLVTGETYQVFDEVAPVAATFLNDEQILLSFSNNTLSVWEFSTDIIVREFGDIGGQQDIEADKDGHLVAISASPVNVALIDIVSGDVVHRLSDLNSINATIDSNISAFNLSIISNRWNGTTLAFNPTGTVLAGGALFYYQYDSGIILWDVATGNILRQLEPSFILLFDLDFSPDGQFLLGTGDTQTIIWNVDTGEIVDQYIKLDSRAFYTGEFSTDSTTIAIGTSNGDIIIRNRFNGGIVNELHASLDITVEGAIRRLKFTPDGRYLLTGSSEGEVIKWDIQNPLANQSIAGHTEIILSIDSALNGDLWLSSSGSLIGFDNGEVVVWDARSQLPLHRFEHELGLIWDIAIAADGSFAIIADSRIPVEDKPTVSQLIYWDLKSLAIVHQTSLGEDSPWIQSIALSPNNEKLLVGLPDGRLMLWDIASWTTEWTIELPEKISINDIIITENGEEAWIGSSNLIQIAVKSGEIIKSYDGPATTIQSLAISGDEKTIIAGALDGTIIVWDLYTEQIRNTMIGGDKLRDVVLLNDDQIVVSMGQDSRLLFWNIETGILVRQIDLNNNPLNVIHYRDGLLIGGDFGGELITWRFEESLNEIVAWTLQNRAVAKFDCTDRLEYRLAIQCDEEGNLLTQTPLPTSAIPTPTPTSAYLTFTPIPSPTPTIIPTMLPTATPMLTLSEQVAALDLPFTPIIPAIPAGYEFLEFDSIDLSETYGESLEFFAADKNGLQIYYNSGSEQVVLVEQALSPFATFEEWHTAIGSNIEPENILGTSLIFIQPNEGDTVMFGIMIVDDKLISIYSTPPSASVIRNFARMIIVSR